MTTSSVNGSGNGARSGAQTLALLATPLNSRLLRALADRPRRLTELRPEAGAPAQTTLRAHLGELARIGSVVKRRRNRFPGVLEFELTKAGSELTQVVTVLERWLERSPSGSLDLEAPPAKAAIKALADGWSTAILRALAARPLSLTELDHIIGSLSYPSLERRLVAMRLTRQIEARPGSGKGTPYAVTTWLRQGVAPLAAAIRWERRHLPTLAPGMAAIDVEATFLLAAPLLRLPTNASGSCRMAMEIQDGKSPRLAGALVEVGRGRVIVCETRLCGSPSAWASGSTDAWLAAMLEADWDRLELGGDGHLARTLLAALHHAMSGAPQIGSRSRDLTPTI